MAPPNSNNENFLDNSVALSTSLPAKDGFFGDQKEYGGAFLPPPLVPVMQEIAKAYDTIKTDEEFLKELQELRKTFIGRPSPIYHCKNLSAKLGGAQIYLKREDLNHTGSHKINHCLGEALLAKRLGKKKLIAETGAGQHGVALATAAALMEMECEIHMVRVLLSSCSTSHNVERERLTFKRNGRTFAGCRCWGPKLSQPLLEEDL